MTLFSLTLILPTLFLAYSNYANDNFKGVAMLPGIGLTQLAYYFAHSKGFIAYFGTKVPTTNLNFTFVCHTCVSPMVVTLLTTK